MTLAEKWNSADDKERRRLLSNIGIGGLGWLAHRFKQWKGLPVSVRNRLKEGWAEIDHFKAGTKG